jgi:DNA-binding MarR family transcriptional regulator
VQREDDKADRRRSLLKLTSEGKRYDELRTGTVESAVKRALARVSAEDADAAARVLSAVTVELQRED